jgi:hypothetical protein
MRTGAEALLHNCDWLVDWSTEHDVELPFVE